MATSTITHTVTDGSGSPVGAGYEVEALLMPGNAFRASSGTGIARRVTTTTDSSGSFSLSLEQQSNIVTPANTWWQISIALPDSKGGPQVYAISVGAAGATLFASLVTPSSDTGLANYLTQESADARYLRSAPTLGYVSALDYCEGDGTTDDTAGAIAAATAAAAAGKALFFPPTSNGYVLQRVFLSSTHAGLKIFGNGTILIHKVAATVPVSGSDTKAVPIFMVERDCDGVEISGFTFQSTGDIAALVASTPGYESYYSPIVVHNADDVWVHHNKFRGTEPKCVLVHGGDRMRFEDNDVGSRSVGTFHVGYTANVYFYDAGPSVIQPTYSPIGLRVERNTGHGFSGAYPWLFLSGAQDLSVLDNKCLSANTTDNAIEIYTNDYGIQEGGTPVLRMRGEVAGNIVTGTAAYGLYFNGYSVNATSQIHFLALNVHDNEVEITGNGTNLERCKDINVHHNRINVTKSTVRLAREVYYVNLSDNALLSTGSPTSSLAWNIASVCDVRQTRICNNRIYIGAGSFKWLHTADGSNIWEDVHLCGNEVEFEGDVANPTLVEVKASGYFCFSNHRWIINSSRMAGRQMLVVTGSTGAVTLHNHQVITSSVEMKYHEIDCDSVRVSDSVFPGLLATIVTECNVANSKLVLSSTGTTEVVKCISGAMFSLNNNYLESSASLGVPVVHGSATTLTSLHGNRIIGNASVPLLRQSTSGTLYSIGDVQTNNGAGGTTITKTGTAAAFTGDVSAA